MYVAFYPIEDTLLAHLLEHIINAQLFSVRYRGVKATIGAGFIEINCRDGLSSNDFQLKNIPGIIKKEKERVADELLDNLERIPYELIYQLLEHNLRDRREYLDKINVFKKEDIRTISADLDRLSRSLVWYRLDHFSREGMSKIARPSFPKSSIRHLRIKTRERGFHKIYYCHDLIDQVLVHAAYRVICDGLDKDIAKKITASFVLSWGGRLLVYVSTENSCANIDTKTIFERGLKEVNQKTNAFCRYYKSLARRHLALRNDYEDWYEWLMYGNFTEDSEIYLSPEAALDRWRYLVGMAA